MAEPATRDDDYKPDPPPSRGADAPDAVLSDPAPKGGDTFESLTRPDPKLVSDLTENQRRKLATDDRIRGEEVGHMIQDRDLAASYLRREGVAMDDVKPWDAKTERAKFRSDPIADFGSFASVFAIAASAFTKTPMTNALNASAAAMNAVRERNDEEYKYAYQAWKDNTELAIKRSNMMHQQYSDAMALFNTDVSIGEAQLKQSAARFGDQKALLMLEHGMVPEFIEYISAQAKATEGLTKSLAATTEYTIRKSVFDADLKSNPQASPQQQMTMFENAMGIDTDPKKQWNRQYWAAHPATGDPKADYDNWLAEYKKFAEASSPYKFTTSTQNASELARRMDEYAKEFEAQGHSPEESRRMGFDKANSELAASKVAPHIDLASIGWDERSIESAARTYNKTGIMPKNIGNRNVAAQITGAVTNKANELLAAEGISPEQRAQNWQKYGAQKIAIQRFESGPQGNTIRSLGVVVDHLGTLRRLAEALRNGNVPAMNSLFQKIAQETGSSVPTNFDMAKNIVGTEIIKSLGVAGAGTQAERQEAAEAFSRRGSPRQIMDGIDKVMRPLMLGQLKGLERQFVKSTGLTREEFLQSVGPEAESFMRGDKPVRDQPTQQDVDWAKKNDANRKMFVDKFGREP